MKSRNIMLNTRKVFSSSKLKKRLVEKLTHKRRLKIGNNLSMFLMLSYYAYMKQLAKQANLNALIDKKRAITSEHIIEAHQTILEKTKLQRKQRTLDEMLKNHSTTYRSLPHL